MATPFNIIAQLQLQAPTNLNTIVGNIQSSLSSITATINLTVSPTTISALAALTGQLNALNTVLAAVQAAATNASTALSPLGGSLSRVHSGTQQINSALVQTAPQLNQIATATRNATGLLENFGIQAGLAARRYTAFLLAGGAIVGFVNELRNAVGEAVSFQREMTRLAQVGNDTAGSLKDIEGTITRLSVNLGVSSKDLLGVSLQLRQAGLNASDTKIALDALAKSALAPSFGSLSDTTEGLISAMSQFKLSASDAERTLGAINAVSTQYAVSSKDIIDAIRRTGGAFHAAGGNLNELIALFGAVRSTSRESAESIGSSLRTILVRTQRSDFIEDMHRLGIELRYTREEATRLGSVNLANQFVGPYEAVRRLSEGVKGLRSTDPRFAGLSTELGGYRQISKTVPLLQEFAKAQEIYKTAQSGSNSLTKSAEEAQGAFLIKITKVKEEFSALIRTVTESKGFQVFLDIILQITSGLNKLAGTLTPLIPLLAGLAAFQLARGTGRILGGFLAGASGQSPRFATGGIVPGSGDGDTVPAILEPGEFVIRKQAAHRLGYNTLHELNTGAKPRKYAQGGTISLKPGHRLGQVSIYQDAGGGRETNEVNLPDAPDMIHRYYNKLPANMQQKMASDRNSQNEFFGELRKYKAVAPVDRYIMKSDDVMNQIYDTGARSMDRKLNKIGGGNPKGTFVSHKAMRESAQGFIFEGFLSSFDKIAATSGQSPIDFPRLTREDRSFINNLFEPKPIKANDIDAKRTSVPQTKIIIKAMNADLFYTKKPFDDVTKEFQNKWFPKTQKKATGGIVQYFAHGGDVYDEFDPKEREWAKGWIDQYNTPELSIHEKLLRTGESHFPIHAVGTPEEPLTKPLPESILPHLLSYKATGPEGNRPILKDPIIGPYILPGKHRSLGQIVGNIAPEPKQLEGPNILNMDPVYLIAPGSPQQGGDKTVNLSVADLVDAKGKPTSKYSISTDAIKRLQSSNKTGVTGIVHSYTIASNATDVFNQEFLGPVNQAIDGVFKQKFATGHGKGLDYSLGPNELKTISGYLFERYVSGLFGVQRNPEGQGYFDYPGPFPSREGLDKILYPHGPVKGAEGDAKNSYTKERTYELAGKWLNKYRGVKFAEGGAVTTDDIKRIVSELSTSTGIDFSKFVSSIKYQAHIPSNFGEDAGVYGRHRYTRKTGKSNIGLNRSQIKDVDQLKTTLTHELGHAVDYYIGQGTLDSEYKGTEHNKYGKKYAQAKIAEHQKEYNNVLTGKEAAYAYSTREGFANIFSEHLTEKPVRGFDRRVIEKVAKMTNPNYEEKDLGFLGNLARKPGIVGGAARLFGYAQGGSSKGTDTVPALLTPGEFVINREAAQRIGYGRLHAMNQEGVARYAKGGPVYMATGGRMAKRAHAAISQEVADYLPEVGVANLGDLSEISKVQLTVEALNKLYQQHVENARKSVLASGKVSDNMEATRLAIEGVENNFENLKKNLAAAGAKPTQLADIGLGGTVGNIGDSLKARRKEFKTPLPTAVPAWYQTEILAGSAVIPAAMAEHREAHGLTGGQELSAHTKRQISAQALAENYDRMVKETSAELLATKQARSKVEADRLAIEKANAVHQQLAKEAELQLTGGGSIRSQLGEAADAGGTGYLTRGQRLRRGANRIANKLYENGYAIAGTAIGTAAYYTGQGLEQSAGTPENAVLGGEATQEAYVGRKAAAGGIQGAVTAGAIGFQVGGVPGAVVGAAIGGLAGFTQALTKAKEEILKAANELAGKRFEAAVGGFERGNAGAGQDITTQFKQRDMLLAEKQGSFWYHAQYDYAPGWLGFGGETEKHKETTKARQEAEWREANAPFLGGEQRLLAGAASRYGQNLRGSRGSIDEFAKGSVAGQSIQSLIELVARGRGLGKEGEKTVRQELEAQVRTSASQLTSVRETAKVDAVARDFELLVLSARNAASGLNELARATKVTEDLFSGTVSAIQFRAPAEALDQMGGPNPQEFARSVKEIAAPFGERGAAFQSTALGLDEAQRRFSAGLPDMLKGYRINPLQSGEQLADSLEKVIRKGEKSPEMDPIIDAMKGRLVNIGEGKQIQELIANPDKLRKQLFGDLQQDVTRTGQELSKILEASANAFSTASARFQQQLGQIGKVIDEQAKLTGEAMQIRARGRAELAGNLGGLALNTPLATREYAYRAVQTRLTGEAGLGSGEAFDPVAIGRRQREVQDEILARRQAMDAQPGIRGGPEWDAAVNKLHQLEKVSGDLSQALQHLGQVSERNASIEERLAALRKDQEGRTNIAERYLSGDADARLQIYRGNMYASTLAKGGDIQQMSPDAIKDLMALKGTAPGLLFKDQQGQQIPLGDLVQRALEHTNLPGMGPTNVRKQEIAMGVAQQARNADVGEAALGQEARNMRRMADKQFGMWAQGGASDINVRLNENMERLNQSVVELRDAIEAAGKVPLAEGVAEGGPVKYYGFGSAVFKPKGTDTIPAMLTPNEYVVNAKSAQANKALLEKINSARGPVYLAEGGFIFEKKRDEAVQEARTKHRDLIIEAGKRFGYDSADYNKFKEGRLHNLEQEIQKANIRAKREQNDLRTVQKHYNVSDIDLHTIEPIVREHAINIATIEQQHNDLQNKSPITSREEGQQRLKDFQNALNTAETLYDKQLRLLLDKEHAKRNTPLGPAPQVIPHKPVVDKNLEELNRQLLAPETVKPPVAKAVDPLQEMNKVLRNDKIAQANKRLRVDAFGKERPDIINGHLPRNIQEAEKVAKKRNLSDPYSIESMTELYNKGRKVGRGDIGSINTVIDAAKNAQAGEIQATGGMEGFRRGMAMVRSGRHIAGLGGGQYNWGTTGRAATERIEKNLNTLGQTVIEHDLQKRHHGADLTGFVNRLRLARGHGFAANPTVHSGNFQMVNDEHGKLFGRLIPGSGIVVRLDKFQNLRMGDKINFSKAQLEDIVTDGRAARLNEHPNWKISPIRLATGGVVHGSDSVPALLTPGEFVLNASAASSLGYNRLQAFNTRYLQEGGDVYEQSSGEAAREKLMRGPVTTSTSNISPTGAGGNFGGDINRLSAAFTTFSTKVTEFANAVAKIPPSLAMTYNGNLNVNINGAEALAKIAEPLKDMVVSQATNAINHMISTRMGGEVPQLGGPDIAAINVEGSNRAK
jgi:hypothetical protein